MASDPEGRALARSARSLLRRLRDLNVVAHRVRVPDGMVVTLDGCLSKDAPVEGGVRYRVAAREDEHVLSIRAGEATLRVALSHAGAGGAKHSMALACEEWRGLEEADAGELERFLRRVVRRVFT